MDETKDVWAKARKWQRIRNALFLLNIACVVTLYILFKKGHFKYTQPLPQAQLQVDTPLYTNFATPYGVFGKITAKGGAKMREKPISSSKVITKIDFYEPVKILDMDGPEDFISGQSGNWYKVEYNTHQGWIWGRLIKEDK